jgi:hypothetical protein
MKQVTDTAPTIIWVTQHRRMRGAGHVAHIRESIEIVNKNMKERDHLEVVIVEGRIINKH